MAGARAAARAAASTNDLGVHRLELVTLDARIETRP